MAANNFKHLTITDVQFLPIVKEYARRIQLVDTINQMVPTDMELKPGIVVLAMVLDSLSSRSPLYRLMNFFDEKDTELLLGEKVPASRFTDYNIGRALDCIFETGTQKIFGQLSQNAVGGFKIQPTGAHYDTTSITVFGDYAMTDEPFEITYGYSKDKRPDLKQFLVEMLCVERNIPLFGATRDGNASDKTLNNELLSHISKHMARHEIEEGAFVYVADSAFVTKENLEKAGTRPVLRRASNIGSISPWLRTRPNCGICARKPAVSFYSRTSILQKKKNPGARNSCFDCTKIKVASSRILVF